MKAFLSVSETAAATGLGAPTIRAYVAARVIPAVRVGRRVLIPRSWLEDLERRALENGRRVADGSWASPVDR